jgi:hypothetical protein
VLFAPGFPLAPLFSILCNFIEMRTNIENFAFYSKRFQAKGADGIGSWKALIEVRKYIIYIDFLLTIY